MRLDEARLVIRPAGVLEAALLAAMQAACFAETADLGSQAEALDDGADAGLAEESSAWDESAFAGLLSGPDCFALIALRDREPIGFALARQAADECELLSLGVLPAQRRLGTGRALLSALCEQATANGVRHIYLEVAADNYAGRALYQALGFVPSAWRKNYYRKPGQAAIDAAVLMRNLT